MYHNAKAKAQFLYNKPKGRGDMNYPERIVSLRRALKALLNAHLLLYGDYQRSWPAEPGEDEFDPEKSAEVIQARRALAQTDTLDLPD